MASGPQQQILIVEDDLDLAEMLSAYFSVQGYKILTAAWGEDAVKLCHEKLPDLVVLDIRLPDTDGYQVARRLRGHRRTKHLPIIFLTEKRDRIDKLAGLELGVVDYITKPFDIQELRLRVRNTLRRATSRKSLENPVTGLPEGSLVDKRLEELVKDKNGWALLVVGLRGLSDFRDRYGFVASDDVLRAVSIMIRNVAKDKDADDGEPEFIGHLEQQDFLVVTREEGMQSLSERVQKQLDASMAYFYPTQDRKADDKEGKRLRVKVGTLSASDGPFASAEALKEAVLKARDKA